MNGARSPEQDRLLDVARRVALHARNGGSLRDFAKRAGVSEGTIYNLKKLADCQEAGDDVFATAAAEALPGAKIKVQTLLLVEEALEALSPAATRSWPESFSCPEDYFRAFNHIATARVQSVVVESTLYLPFSTNIHRTRAKNKDTPLNATVQIIYTGLELVDEKPMWMDHIAPKDGRIFAYGSNEVSFVEQDDDARADQKLQERVPEFTQNARSIVDRDHGRSDHVLRYQITAVVDNAKLVRVAFGVEAAATIDSDALDGFSYPLYPWIACERLSFRLRVDARIDLIRPRTSGYRIMRSGTTPSQFGTDIDAEPITLPLNSAVKGESIEIHVRTISTPALKRPRPGWVYGITWSGIDWAAEEKST